LKINKGSKNKVEEKKTEKKLERLVGFVLSNRRRWVE